MLDEELLALEGAARFGTKEDAAAWTRALLRVGRAFANCLSCFGTGWRETPKRGRFPCAACAAGEPSVEAVPLPPVDRYGRGGRVDRGSWRDRARPIIGDVLRATHGRGEKVVRAALRAAYPWGQRSMLPYKVWCDEIRRQRGFIKRVEVLSDEPTAPLFAGVHGPAASAPVSLPGEEPRAARRRRR